MNVRDTQKNGIADAAFAALLETITTSRQDIDAELVTLAYEFARDAHVNQKRLTGEPYIIHPIAVAHYLAEHRGDESMILAGLLHDALEDTAMTADDIKKNFGDEVRGLVLGVTVLDRIKYRGVDRYIENLRKMFVAMARDVRVIIIKFADRIDNLRTLDAMPEEKRFRIAKETIEIYAPIANRLSMGEMRGDLEDLAFPHLEENAFIWTKKLLESASPQREKYLEEVQKIVKSQATKESIPLITMNGRRKRLYSLYQKLLTHDRDIGRIYDLIALRIIVPDIQSCYAILGMLHALWRPLKGRIKDYIANPKPNGYRSLHTTVFCEQNQIVEFQIRTQEMHESAEFGVAGHWRRKGGAAARNERERMRQESDWIRELARWHHSIRENQEHLEGLKLDIFKKRIFVFTPKGEIIDLPEDATPVDFAYTIHTSLGNQCSFAIVNNEKSTLDTKLRSGDMVEIIPDKKRKTPSPDWLSSVKTSRARSKIKEQLKGNVINWIKKSARI